MSSNAVFVRSKKKKAYACLQAGRFEEAKAIYSEVCRLDKRDAETWFLLGAINGQLGRYEEAIDCGRQAVALRPDYTDAHYNLGQAYLHLERPAEAAACYREVVRLKPDHADAHNNLGHAIDLQGRYDEAIPCFQQALKLQRDHADAWNNLGNAFQTMGANSEGIDSLRQAIRFRPDFTKAHVNLGFALCIVGELDKAREEFHKVLKLEPGNTDAVVGQAMIHEKEGEFDAAWKLLHSLGKKTDDDLRFALAFAKVARHFDRHAEAVAMLERLLAQGKVQGQDTQPVHFLLGELNDKLKQYDRAFPHYQQANALKHVGPDGFLQAMQHLMTLFTPEFVARAPRAANASERPLFIVGMPRSGTTLTEQILSSHPAVFGAGELDEMRKIADSLPGLLGGKKPYPACLEDITSGVLNVAAQRYLDRLAQCSADALRVTDKMPHNFIHLGLIALMFPRARVIHCRRHPLDTCLSIFTYDFNSSHGYAADLARLGTHYCHYRELMEHWKRVLPLAILDVQYEELVADQERMTRAMLEFAGLEWDDRCLRFYENKRVVNTLSYDQVRRPIYTQSVARWKHYERHLEPLKIALGLSSDTGDFPASGTDPL